MTGTYRYSRLGSYGVDGGSLQGLGEDGVGEGTDQAEPVDLHRQVTEREKESYQGTSSLCTAAVAAGTHRRSPQSTRSERMPSPHPLYLITMPVAGELQDRG